MYLSDTKWTSCVIIVQIQYTLNSTYNEVAFNEKSAITKENLCTKYTPFTHEYIALNEKPPIMKQNLHIFFFIIGRVECTNIMTSAVLLYKLYKVFLHYSWPQHQQGVVYLQIYESTSQMHGVNVRV